MAGDPPDDEPLSPAAALLFEFLEQRASGEETDVETLCRRRPDLAEQLRRLHARYQGLLRSAPPASGEAEPPSASDAAAATAALTAELRDALQRRYDTGAEIARGGMGTIRQSIDRALRRTVAKKVLLRSGADPAAADPRMLARFLGEARVTGLLEHPGVVPVHDVGIDDDGRVFYTMPLVRGRDLEAIIALARAGAEGWSIPRVVGTLVRVCETLAYAHSKGVVHRDVKPANIMVGPFGETWLMDWGLARIRTATDSPEDRRSAAAQPAKDEEAPAEASPLLTLPGDVLGTPAYMAPEQARGETERVSFHADVYAVGAVLYKLLTGRAPHTDAGSTADEVLERVRRADPVAVLDLAPAVPPELAAICRKAMARDPGERYPAALAMADDLRAWLEGRVVRAFEGGAFAELRKWVRRNRALAGALALSVLLLLGGALAVAVVESQRRATAEDAQRRVEDALHREQHEAYLGNLTAAALHLQEHDAGAARVRLARCPEALRGFEWRHLDLRIDLSREILGGAGAHRGMLTSVSFSADGRRIATAGDDGVARVFEDGRLLREFRDGAHKVALHPDGSQVAFDVGDAMRICAVGDGSRVAEHAAGVRVTAVAYAPDGHRVAYGTADGSIWLVGGEGSSPRRLASSRGAVHSLAFAQAGSRLAAGTFGGEAWVFGEEDSSGHAPVLLHLQGLAPVYSVDLSPDGARLAMGCDDRVALVFDVAQQVQVLQVDHAHPVFAVAFHPDGVRLLTGTQDPVLRVFDATTGALLASLTGHGHAIRAVAAAPDGSQIATGSFDHTVRLWHGRLEGGIPALRGPQAGLRALAMDRSGSRIVTGSSDRTTVIWDGATGAVLRTLTGHAGWVTGVAVGGGRGASCSSDGTLQVFELGGLELEGEGSRPIVLEPRQPVWAVALAPDGARVACGVKDGSVLVFDAATGALVGRLDAHRGRVTGVAYDALGRVLVSGAEDGVVQVFDAATLVPRARFESAGMAVHSVAVAAGGERAAAGLYDGTVLLMETRPGAEPQRLTGHSASVKALAFAPDGRRLFSGSDDQTLRIWDPARAEPLVTLRGPAAPVWGLAASDTRVVAAGIDGSVRVFESDREALRALRFR